MVGTGSTHWNSVPYWQGFEHPQTKLSRLSRHEGGAGCSSPRGPLEGCLVRARRRETQHVLTQVFLPVFKIIPKASSPGREMKCEEGESARSPPPLLPPASLLAWSPILLPPWGPAFLPALYPAAFRSAFPG